MPGRFTHRGFQDLAIGGAEREFDATEIETGPDECGEGFQTPWPLDGGRVQLHVYPTAAEADGIGDLGDTANRGRRPAQIADPDGVVGAALKQGALAIGRHAGPSAFWMAQASLAELLAVLGGAHPVGGEDWVVQANPKSGLPGLVARVESRLAAHLVAPVRLDGLARALHMSRSSLSHRYKKLTGTSPMQMLLRLRIEQAKRLLVRGYKLDDIAGQCGFYDAAHFSRVFQARTGQTPRRFARAVSGGRA